MVPLGLFRDRNFSGGSLSLTLVQIGNGGLLLVVTQYLQFVLDYTPMQAGAALGVAILGSVLSGAYTAAMPESAPEAARRSIQDAFAVAAATGDAGLATTARDAFTSAMSISFVAAAIGAFAGAVLSLVMIRDRKREAVEEELVAA